MVTLKYNDEADRAYGISGMAVALVIWENDKYLSALNIDGEADSGIEFTPDFFMMRNPKSSPRMAWNETVERFQLISGLLISNILCRSLVKAREDITPQLRQEVVRLLREEGRAVADLTDQEVEAIFSKGFNYFHKIFSHAGIGQLATDLADALSRDRRVDRDRMLEILAPLTRM